MKYFSDKLTELNQNGLYRQLQNYDSLTPTIVQNNNCKYISFCSNDYLGLSHNRKVVNTATQALTKYGFGSGASRYITGNNNFHQKLEKQLAKMKQTEAAMVLGSGYLSGIGIIPALVDHHDLIIADKLIHSSLIDGSRLSKARMIRFRHNELKHCRNLLKEHRHNYRQCLLITETVFSMDGDLGNITDLLELAIEFNCLLLSDDAHGLGIIKQPQSLSHHAHLQCGTLSKAAGGYGGYICGSATIIDYLRNFARPAIYSTALPPAILAGNLQALKIIATNEKLGKKALDNAAFFCKLLDLPPPSSAIVVMIIGDVTKTVAIADEVRRSGFLISAIRPPTVEKNKARLRITFSALHKKADIKKLAFIIRPILDKLYFNNQ